jgi:oxygen-dependent protoporphyrinogen oxidase
MSPAPQRRILIVGGGITGLAAAVTLVDSPGVSVELWEASNRLGGKLKSSPFAGVEAVDEGADAYLTRVPFAVDFARHVGLDDADLTAPTKASASVWYDRMHDIPGGVLLGMPASIRPFVTASLLSPMGKLRAALEPLRPRTDPDDSLGALIRARFGNQVHERLVDALVGSIYATDTDRWSLAAVPQLAELAGNHRSLLLGGRAARRNAPASVGPIFAAPIAGMAGLIDAASKYIRLNDGVLVTSRAPKPIEPDGRGADGRWIVDGEHFDGVVLATPSNISAELLTSVAPTSAEELRRFEHADVILVRLAIAQGDWPQRLRGRSGYLVPKPKQRHVTAASFGSQKWAHWTPSSGSQILRVSLGRDGLGILHLSDDEAIAAALSEVSNHLGFDVNPTDVSLTRWPKAFPQYRPHHHERVMGIEANLPKSIALAGAAFRGIGIPACIADGQWAARRIKEATS